MARVVGKDKPLAWLHGENRTPPFSRASRIEAGDFLRELQRTDAGRGTALPRAEDRRRGATWRIVCRIDPDAIVIVEVFAKKTAQTPAAVLEACRRRLKECDDA